MGIFEGTAFNVISAVIGVVTIVLTVIFGFFSWRSLYPPKRRLEIKVRTPAALLAASASSLEVRHSGAAINEPHVINFSIEGTGRHDVGTDQFDANRPLILEIGAKIVEVVEVVSFPATSASPSYQVDSNSIKVGPGLISRGQVVRFQVLTEDEPRLRQQDVTSHLIDTAVRVSRDDPKPPNRRYQALQIGVAVLAVLVSGAVLVQAKFNQDRYDRLFKSGSNLESTLQMLALDPQLQIVPRIAVSGGTVLVEGSGFSKSDAVALFVGHFSTQRVPTDEQGAFTVEVTIRTVPSDPEIPELVLILGQDMTTKKTVIEPVLVTVS